jgi:hypothetical protein
MNRNVSWGTKILGAIAVAAVLLGMGSPVLADTSFKFDVSTNYAFALPAGCLTPFGGPSPDTGFWIVTNTGTSTFAGSVGQTAIAGNGGNFNFTQFGVTLNPGQMICVAVNAEASNMGGYNGPTGTVQPGVQINIVGAVTDPSGSSPISLSVLDSQIHSGVPRTNPFGVTLDNYVLQGGDPLGRDTGDGFETTQAPGHITLTNAIPEPSTIVLMLSGGAALAGLRRLRKKR